MTKNERLQRAKIPSAETGITIQHTICDICTPGPHCGIDAYVKDGKILKIEGTKGFPTNNGKLCTKGAAGRQYVYREDRITQPMRRTGPRGSGKFEPITWDEAFAETARQLNKIKRESGPEAVFFISGYAKWYRTFLHRLAYSFGSPNYLTESSSCHWSEVIAGKCIFGEFAMPDTKNTRLTILWGADPFTKNIRSGQGLMNFKQHGGQVIVIDPRNTRPAQRLASLYLRPRLGTDGVLAHAMAKVILERGLHDADFIARYVHGFEPYRDYVMGFDLATAERITGIPAADIEKTAVLFAETDPSAIQLGTGITHRTNGFNNARAILSLSAITGRFDRPGTLLPAGETTFCNSGGGFPSREPEFIQSVRPKTDKPAVGTERFPLFRDMMDEGQGMDLANQILSGKPYPLRAAFCAGLNHMMYPDSRRFLHALQSLDFFAASDVFWTDVCRNADIVLPACTSFERSEVKCYAGRFMLYTRPAIQPLGESRSDTDIFSGLARALDLDDELLKSGYDACARFMLEESSGITGWDAFREHDGLMPAPNAKSYVPGTLLSTGLNTPTGKIELYSEVIARYQDHGLEPLPVWHENADPTDPGEYPFVLCAGARLYNAIHSRVHANTWLRALRPEASVDINPADAARLGIEQGDPVELSTPVNTISVRANITEEANTGELQMYHGYPEADVNSLLSAGMLDPYTGFPSYKQFRCRLTKRGDGA